MINMMTASIIHEIINILSMEDSSTVAILTRRLNERGIPCTRQKVERVLRDLIGKEIIEAYYINSNHRKHYRLRST